MDKSFHKKDGTYTLRSRRIVFEREVRSLENLMYGGSVCIWPYMTDALGDYSEERTMNLVNQIADEEYDGETDRLSFYRNLLYCVLRTITSGYTEYQNGNIAGFGTPEHITFSLVMDSLENASGGLLDNNIVYFMGELYLIFMQREIHLDRLCPMQKKTEISREILQQMNEEADARMAMEDVLAEKQGINMAEIRAEEQQESKRERRQRIQEQERIRNGFAEREYFCRCLEKVCCYLEEHQVNQACLQRKVRNGIFWFLSERNLTVFDKEEAFVEVMVQLKKTIRTAKRYAED